MYVKAYDFIEAIKSIQRPNLPLDAFGWIAFFWHLGVHCYRIL
jgi:hypothetical protein